LYVAISSDAKFLHSRSDATPIRVPVAGAGFPNYTASPQLGDDQVRFANASASLTGSGL
jgi:hypothetical protein